MQTLTKKTHPAKYNAGILDASAVLIKQYNKDGAPVIYDPFCGVGTVRYLKQVFPSAIVFGSDIEAEWASQWSSARVADATDIDQMRAAVVGRPTPNVICSSPAFDNGMNDHFQPKRERLYNSFLEETSCPIEAEKQLVAAKQNGAKIWRYNTYRYHLGRALHENNMGRYNSRSGSIDKYLEIARASAANIAELFPGAIIVWNTKPAYRTQPAGKALRSWESIAEVVDDDKVMIRADTPQLWYEIWTELGYLQYAVKAVKSPGNREGENRHRFNHDDVSVYIKRKDS